jgi:predicted hotdog family 3-hydroxylacyl-ACP dehydratase
MTTIGTGVANFTLTVADRAPHSARLIMLGQTISIDDNMLDIENLLV